METTTGTAKTKNKADANGEATKAQAAAVEVSEVDRLIAEQEAPLDLQGQGYTKVRTEIDAFYNPQIRVAVPGVANAFKEVTCKLAAIPIQKKRRPAKQNEPEKQGLYYVCIVTQPMLAKDSDGNVVALKQGQTVWVDERYDFRMLENLMPRRLDNGQLVGGEVIAKPIEKINLRSGGRTKWRFDLFMRYLDGNQMASYGLGDIGTFNSMKALAASNEVEGEEVPF